MTCRVFPAQLNAPIVQIFTIVSLAFLTVFVNSLLVLFRSRVNPATHAVPPPYPIPPAVPFHAPHAYLPPAHEWNGKGWKRGDDEGEELASRRRRLEDGQAAKVK